MADSRVKKVVIPKSKLPAYSGENQSYIVRYRIVSEDKNRNSHWSPQYKLPVTAQLDKTKNPPDPDIPNAVEISTSGNSINILWTPPAGISQEFHVYLKWNGVGEYVYEASVTSPSYSVLKPAGATSIQVVVQVPTFPKKVYQSAKLFESSPVSLVV